LRHAADMQRKTKRKKKGRNPSTRHDTFEKIKRASGAADLGKKKTEELTRENKGPETQEKKR